MNHKLDKVRGLVTMRSGAGTKEIKVKAVEKTLKILEILAEHDSALPLTRLGQISEMSLSTVHRLLNTLCQSGFVEREPETGHYRLGLKAFLIGNAALQNVKLRPTALTAMQKLSEEADESVYLAILSNQNVIYSDSVRTAGPIQIGIQTGVPVPACQTGSGKILLAHLSKPELHVYFKEYLAKKLIQEPERFLEELNEIKQKGFASDSIALGGNVREIGAPIFNHLGACIGTIGVFRPASEGGLTFSDKILVDQVRRTAEDISSALGCVGA